MRVACVSSHRDTLNSVRPEAELFIGLARAGVAISVLTQGDSIYADRMRAAGVDVIDFEPRSKLSPASIRFLRRTLGEGGYDLVYAFNNKAIANTNVAALGLPLRVVTYRGQTGNIHRYDPSAYLTHLNPRVDAIIAVANAVADSLRPHLRARQCVFTVYKGHDLGWYTDVPLGRDEFGLDASHRVVTCVANNRPRKGVPVLLEAFSQLGDVADLRLVLIGAGMDEASLGADVRARGLEGRVRLLGFRSDAPAILAASDLSVLPSTRREGLPKTVIESMAYGVAPVVTDTGGSAELVKHGVSGLVVPPSDAPALADALRRLAGDDVLCRQYGTAARKRIGSEFTVERSVTDTLAAFRSILDR